jgi:hypothetical protein
MKEVIIATFNRDYSWWVKNLNKDIKVTVYNKSDIEILNTIKLNNIGREMHTYFYHIVTNYYNLSDYTFFSQDDFIDHVINYTDIINGDKNTWSEHGKLIFSDCWFFSTGYPILTCDKFGYPNHPNLDIEPVWNQLFIEECPEELTFAAAGHFCISKEHAHKRPIEFYKKVLNILETNKDAPWIIERLEPYIFNINYSI